MACARAKEVAQCLHAAGAVSALPICTTGAATPPSVPLSGKTVPAGGDVARLASAVRNPLASRAATVRPGGAAVELTRLALVVSSPGSVVGQCGLWPLPPTSTRGISCVASAGRSDAALGAPRTAAYQRCTKIPAIIADRSATGVATLRRIVGARVASSQIPVDPPNHYNLDLIRNAMSLALSLRVIADQRLAISSRSSYSVTMIYHTNRRCPA